VLERGGGLNIDSYSLYLYGKSREHFFVPYDAKKSVVPIVDEWAFLDFLAMTLEDFSMTIGKKSGGLVRKKPR
jgi:hypothetical protein